MADALMPESYYASIQQYLPEERPTGPQGGRPYTSNYTVVKVIYFVLVTGCKWCDVPLELGCCGETARMRTKLWQTMGIWHRLHELFLTYLKSADVLEEETVVIDSTHVRAYGGGDETGPSPVDRRKIGSKLTLLTDKNGVPLTMNVAGANVSDHRLLLKTISDFPRIGGKRGRPLEHPQDAYADAGYDSEDARTVLRWLGIEPHIRKKGTEHGSGLGKVRWVVERTISWVKGMRRLRIRYDRKIEMISAWLSIAQAAICFHIWQDAVSVVT